MFDIRAAKSLGIASNPSIVATLVALTVSICTVLLIAEGANASDPSPVNPPGEIPAIVFDTVGNVYEVFTPEEGGVVVGDGFSFEALPGDVPSAVVVAIRMSMSGPASNAGMTHHRYTIGGNYHVISAVDGEGKPLNAPFRFRTPAIACVPMPGEYLANIDTVRLVAMEPSVGSQTVLSSTYKLDRSGLKMCGYVGTVPTTVAVGIEGAPAPIPPTPVVEVRIVELPVTGGVAVATGSLAILLLAGFVMLMSALVVFRFRTHRTN